MASILLAAATVAQKQVKPWKEWNRKEAEKIFNDSAWSRAQTERASSQSSADVPANFGDTRGREDSVRNVSTSASVTFNVRLFSARPIRQAYVRMLELGETAPDAAAIEKMEMWANLQADDRIIVAVSCTGDQQLLGRIISTLRNATTSDLKKSIYLERNDGKRVLLTDYAPPARDIFGARFTFPRTIDGQPFLTADAGLLRFYVEYEPKIPDANIAQTGSRQSSSSNRPSPYKLKLDLKFKPAEMIYNGELEY